MKKYKCSYSKCRKMLAKPKGHISYCTKSCRSKAEKGKPKVTRSLLEHYLTLKN